MHKFLPRFLLTLLVAVSSVALADPAALGEAIGKFDITKYGKPHEVIVYKIEDVRSKAATQDDFAIELGYKLHDLTAQNGVENCATICRAKDGSGAWSARIITVGAHAFCPTLVYCEEGFEETGVDIHSHLHVTRYLPNDIDRLTLQYDYGPRDRVSTFSDAFSEGDLEGEPGYLVSDRAIRFHDGKNQHKVWDLAATPKASTLVAKDHEAPPASATVAATAIPPPLAAGGK